MSQLITAKKPILGLTQIINMSVGFLGIQFGFGLQNANVSRIFQSLGAKIDDIPILWIAAPLTGLIMQPVIGHLSDKTWSPKWGRRRPFFLIGAILASLALIFFAALIFINVVAAKVLMSAEENKEMEFLTLFIDWMIVGTWTRTCIHFIGVLE